MTHDRHGQLYAGAIGLFDDPNELAFSNARLEGQHAIATSKARKRAEKQRRKDEAAKRMKYERPSWMQRFTRFLGFGEKSGRDGRVTEKLYEEEYEERERDVDAVRGMDGEDPVIYDWKVDDELDSPLYQELGLVRTKARHGMDVKIVHKSQIHSSKPLADYGE